MTSTAPIFLRSHYFRQNIWPWLFVQFHFLYIFVDELSAVQESVWILTGLLKDVIKWGDQLNRLLEKTAANIFEYPGERKIFGKYLLREGLDRQNFCFLVFFSARPDCSIHKILDLSDQPFMFFANMSTNIWLVLYKKLFGRKLWWLWTSQKWNFKIWIKIEQELGLYF